MRLELNKRIFLNFVVVIAAFFILAALLGVSLINRNILNEAQRRVRLNLRSGWSVIHSEINQIGLFVSTLGPGRRVANAYGAPGSPAVRADLETARQKIGFDFLSLTDAGGRVILRTLEPYNAGDYLSNDIFVSGALKGKTTSGLAILSPQRLRSEGGNLEERAFVAFEPTAKAKRRAKTAESAGMAIIAAAPVRDATGDIIGALYAGVLLNRNHVLVDKIRSIVFEDEKYKGRNVGTVTIFQWDTRIATNVTLTNGNRAIGTRVSEAVYDKVLENNLSWYDRAFVVNDWYISAYDPIHDISGNVIGILYVGVLAEKYNDMRRELWKLYGGFSAVAAVFVLAAGFFFSRRLTGSLRQLAKAADQIARGKPGKKVVEPAHDDEILDLTRTFNTMAESLRDREEKLIKANTELEHTNASLQKLNTNYLDMLGFVSHELKNTLGVIYTSARTLDTGMVGTLSEPQATLVRNISKSIGAAVSMTRSYLDLARLESGEMRLVLTATDMSKEIVTPVLEEFKQPIAEKGITVENALPEILPIKADPVLLQMVYRNLISNAIKYGRRQGKIRIGFIPEEKKFRFEVWNEGNGLSPDKTARLFGKFVRFNQETDTSRSAGLGLFITREIISKHGGKLWVESEEG
ncbi:MAG: cache domain-containing protein, partial [Desulfobacteraceae bacterium]|nr:cache domain-containing protein [Desulfobacteraceae bacterium]